MTEVMAKDLVMVTRMLGHLKDMRQQRSHIRLDGKGRREIPKDERSWK